VRDYKEAYIRQYKPSLDRIKLLRSISVCKTPALGGVMYTCRDCGARHKTFKSCGNSHCMICQGKKRFEWQLNLANKLYKVPYAHITFTLPSELRTLARCNAKPIYDLLMQSSWETIKNLSAMEKNVGALPGMVAVLHTFGSDLKYHVHVHCLVTFGGLDKEYKWKNPKDRKLIAKYRPLRNKYREIFLKGLKKAYSQGKINYHLSYDKVIQGLEKKTWVVNHGPPMLDTQSVENYLAKYICRTAVTPKRIGYDAAHQMVTLLHKNYDNQQKGKPAPMQTTNLRPLVMIERILQHKLPKGFHRSRYYGIQSSSTAKKVKPLICESYIRDKKTIKQLFAIMKLVVELLGLPDTRIERCKQCGSDNLVELRLKADSTWPQNNIRGYRIPRSPPIRNRDINREKIKVSDFVI